MHHMPSLCRKRIGQPFNAHPVALRPISLRRCLGGTVMAAWVVPAQSPPGSGSRTVLQIQQSWKPAKTRATGPSKKEPQLRSSIAQSAKQHSTRVASGRGLPDGGMDPPVQAAVAPSVLGNGTKITKTDLKTTDFPPVPFGAPMGNSFLFTCLNLAGPASCPFPITTPSHSRAPAGRLLPSPPLRPLLLTA
jgi:hypothetical protein